VKGVRSPFHFADAPAARPAPILGQDD